MGAAVGDGAGEVRGGEVGTGELGLEVGWVAGAALVAEVSEYCGRFAGCCEAVFAGGGLDLCGKTESGIKILTPWY